MVCGVFVLSVIFAAFADEKADRANMQVFMRKKLEYARNINEGIVLERFDLISFNAAGMRKMAQTNFWMQTNNTNYLAKVAAFQANLDQLFYAGGDRSLDRATAAYGEVLKSCVDCHHFVRKEQLGLPRWGSKEQ
jgi:hypothetical protein